MLTNQELKAIERALGITTESMLQKNLVEYLRGIKEIKYVKLLQSDTPLQQVEERNITIGELRIIEKLLDILEPKA